MKRCLQGTVEVFDLFLALFACLFLPSILDMSRRTLAVGEYLRGACSSLKKKHCVGADGVIELRVYVFTKWL